MRRAANWIAAVGLALFLTTSAAGSPPSFEERLSVLWDQTRNVIDYLQSQNYLIERVDMDLVLAGHAYITFHECYDVYVHKIIGIGESGVVKLDGYILDADGSTVLAYDDEFDSIPVLHFAPPSSGEYRLEFRWEQSAEGYAEDHLGYVAVVYGLQHRQ